MNWDSIKNVVGKAAPLLGTVIGGPGGAIVGALIADALGVDNTPDAVSAALKSDPQAAIKLQELQNTHKEKLQRMGLETLEAELGDKANAREHHKHSPMPAVITLMLTVMVAGLLYVIMFTTIPEGSESLAMMMFGQVFTLWGASITYWVGTTRSSAEKTKVSPVWK